MDEDKGQQAREEDEAELKVFLCMPNYFVMLYDCFVYVTMLGPLAIVEFKK